MITKMSYLVGTGPNFCRKQVPFPRLRRSQCQRTACRLLTKIALSHFKRLFHASWIPTSFTINKSVTNAKNVTFMVGYKCHPKKAAQEKLTGFKVAKNSRKYFWTRAGSIFMWIFRRFEQANIWATFDWHFKQRASCEVLSFFWGIFSSLLPILVAYCQVKMSCCLVWFWARKTNGFSFHRPLNNPTLE